MHAALGGVGHGSPGGENWKKGGGRKERGVHRNGARESVRGEGTGVRDDPAIIGISLGFLGDFLSCGDPMVDLPSLSAECHGE